MYIYIYDQSYCWLVVQSTLLKSMSSSIWMMTFPIYGNIETVSKPPARLILNGTLDMMIQTFWEEH